MWPGESIKLMRKSCDDEGGRLTEEGMLGAALCAAIGVDASGGGGGDAATTPR